MGLDFANERYVRVYTRDSVTVRLLSWQARALLWELVRKADRAGVIEIGEHGDRGVAAIVGMPAEIVGPALAELVTSGTLAASRTAYVLPRYMEAQETPQTDKQRQRESRERRRVGVTETETEAVKSSDDSQSDVTKRDAEVTKRDETSHAVTPCHTPSQSVTLSLAEPSQTTQTQSVERARRASDFASAAIGELSRLTGRAFRPDVAPVVKACRSLVGIGYTPEQAVEVVRAKCRQWAGDEKMRAHLVPSTLLRPSNFAKYLAEDVEAGTAMLSSTIAYVPREFTMGGERFREADAFGEQPVYLGPVEGAEAHV